MFNIYFSKSASYIDKTILKQSRINYIKIIFFVLCFLPVLNLLWVLFFNPIQLGANPGEFIIRKLGDWSIYFLLIGLAITPVRYLTGINQLIKFRRMVGLFAFFYVSIHLLSYLGFDRIFIFGEIVTDVIKRPFIAIGFAAFILLIPLAVTSTRGWTIRIGGKNWSRLHKLVYLIAILGVIHYWWLVKRDLTWPIIFAVILGVELVLRNEKVKRVLKKHSPFFIN
jgi:methionine sulfoxide reductase heme-binding subunit